MWQVPGSSRVKDALGDTIPPAPPVLHSLFPADAHFPKIFLDDIFPVLSRSTWSPPETLRFPYESLWRKSMVIHSWKMSHLRRQHLIMSSSFGSAAASDFLICYFVLPGNPQDTSLPSVVCCFKFFICVTENGHSSALLSNMERTSAS